MAEEDDVETRRLAAKSRRWRLRVPSERAAWMDALADEDPALHAELVALRAVSPQAWRKRLVAEARRRGLE